MAPFALETWNHLFTYGGPSIRKPKHKSRNVFLHFSCSANSPGSKFRLWPWDHWGSSRIFRLSSWAGWSPWGQGWLGPRFSGPAARRSNRFRCRRIPFWWRVRRLRGPLEGPSPPDAHAGFAWRSRSSRPWKSAVLNWHLRFRAALSSSISHDFFNM